MKLFIDYLKLHQRGCLFILALIIIFCVVFLLYGVQMEPVLYAAALCFFPAAVLIILDFVSFARNHRILQGLCERVTVDINGLPVASNLLENDYQKLIRLLFEHKYTVESEAATRYSELMDYYTLWAHQIKTPIAAMRLLLQSQGMEGQEELDEQLFKIEQYVEMVLQYLRTESLSSDLLIRSCSLDLIIRQAIRKYAKSFIRRKITLDYQGIDCFVLTDEKWLTFVVEQLLSNALKYTNGGKISIYMDKKLPMTLVIEDTGIGIQAEDLPRVFEKGYTGYNGRTDKKSTGIGLYLCKRILTKLSHTIFIESEVDVGTRVKIGMNSAELLLE